MKAVILGTLLTAASLFSQVHPGPDPQIKDGTLRWFNMSETREQVAEALGQPRMVAAFGSDFVSWQYQIGISDLHEFSHQIVFRKSTGELVSITRNYEPEINVDLFFPDEQTKVHRFTAKNADFSVRVRRLPGKVLLMAMGSSKTGDKTGQIVLIRESEVRFFHTWLAEQLGASK